MLPRDALEMVKSKTLPRLVQEQILHMIKMGELEAGAKLNEVDMAARLKVSRGPVREAFRALEEAGLVRLEKNRGVFVRMIEPREAAELYEMRGGLDVMAGRKLAAVIADDGIAELRAMVSRMEDSARHRAINDYFPLNIAFHDRLVEMAGNGKLLAIYRRLVDETYLLRRRSLTRGGGFAVSNVEHRAIVDALATRDPDRVAAAVEAHIRNAQARLGSAEQENP